MRTGTGSKNRTPRVKIALALESLARKVADTSGYGGAKTGKPKAAKQPDPKKQSDLPYKDLISSLHSIAARSPDGDRNLARLTGTLLNFIDKNEKARFIFEVTKVFRTRRNVTLELDLLRLLSDTTRSQQLLWRAAYLAVRSGSFEEADRYYGKLQTLKAAPTTPIEQGVVDELEAFRRTGSDLKLLGTAPPVEAGDPIRVGYVMHNCQPYASGGYAIRSHGILTNLNKGVPPEGKPRVEVSGLARWGFPYDVMATEELALPEGKFSRAVDNVDYHFPSVSSRRGHRFAYFLSAADYIEDCIKAQDLKVVHSASNYYTAIPAAIAAARRGLPFVYEVRGFWEVTRLSREPSYVSRWEYKRDRLLESLACRCADHVFTLTSAMKNEIENFGIDSRSITVIPNGVDVAAFSPQPRIQSVADKYDIRPDDIVVGYVGSFVDYEGLDILVDSFLQAVEQAPRLKLMLVGDEKPAGGDTLPVTDLLKSKLRDNVNARNIIFTGRVPHEEARDIYSLIDICPFPRRSLPVTELVSPLKPLEALALEKCVLFSNVGGMREQVVEGETGLLVAPDDIGALRDAIVAAAKNSDLRASLGRSGRKWVQEKRNWSVISRDIRAVYDDLLEQRPGASFERRNAAIDEVMNQLFAGAPRND